MPPSAPAPAVALPDVPQSIVAWLARLAPEERAAIRQATPSQIVGDSYRESDECGCLVFHAFGVENWPTEDPIARDRYRATEALNAEMDFFEFWLDHEDAATLAIHAAIDALEAPDAK